MNWTKYVLTCIINKTSFPAHTTFLTPLGTHTRALEKTLEVKIENSIPAFCYLRDVGYNLKKTFARVHAHTNIPNTH